MSHKNFIKSTVTTLVVSLVFLHSASAQTSSSSLTSLQKISLRFYCLTAPLLKGDVSKCPEKIQALSASSSIKSDYTNTQTKTSLQKVFVSSPASTTETFLKEISSLTPNTKEVVTLQPVYITRYVSTPGPKGEKGDKGDPGSGSGTSGTNPLSSSFSSNTYAGAQYGGYFAPAVNTSSQLVGVSTVGYLNGATSENTLLKATTTVEGILNVSAATTFYSSPLFTQGFTSSATSTFNGPSFFNGHATFASLPSMPLAFGNVLVGSSTGKAEPLSPGTQNQIFTINASGTPVWMSSANLTGLTVTGNTALRGTSNINTTGTATTTLGNASSTTVVGGRLSVIGPSFFTGLASFFDGTFGGSLSVSGTSTLATTTVTNLSLGSLATGTPNTPLLVRDTLTGEIKQVDPASAFGVTNTATSSGNILTTSINGLTATTTLINSSVATSSANLLTTIINGITSTAATIINSFTQTLAGNTLTTTINGVTATSSVISSNALGITGTSLTSTVNGIATSTDLKNLVASSTDNTLSLSGNTLTSTVNGKVATSSAVSSNTLSSAGNVLTNSTNGLTATTTLINSSVATSSANLLTTIINGITSTAATIINSFTQTLAGNTLTTTINGVTATSSVISSNAISLVSSTGLLTSTVNGISATSTLGLTNGQVLFGNSAGGLSQSSNLFWDNANGKLGVGTSTPVGNLHVYTSGAFSNGGLGMNIQTASDNLATFALQNAGAEWQFSNRDSSSNNNFGFYVRPTSGSWLNVMNLTKIGNVGIGTSTPNNKLEITHGTAGNSGLRFTNLTSASTAATSGTKVLSVNASGDVVLVSDATTACTPAFTSGLGGNYCSGINSLQNNTTGYRNISVGDKSLQNNTTGYENTAIGWSSLTTNTTGAANIGIGTAALEANTSGNFNVANGWGASRVNTTGLSNLAQGAYSLYTNQTGSYNVALGDSAAKDLTVGNNNIAIGYNTQLASSTGSNQLNIGNWIYGNGGNIGIGVSSPTATFHLKAGTATAGTSPLKFTSGTNLTTAEAGALEYNGTQLFFSPSTTRNILAQISGSTALTTGVIPFVTTNGYLTGNNNLFWDNTNGKLGLGTTTPAYQLDMTGDLRLGGKIYLPALANSSQTPNFPIPSNNRITFGETYYPPNDTGTVISFASGASTRNMLFAYGKTGIHTSFFGDTGTSTVFGTEAAVPIIFKNGLNYTATDVLGSGTEWMRIDGSGKVGIGTNTPGSALEINSADAGQLRLRNTASVAGKHWRIGPDSSGNNIVVYNQNGAGVYMTDGSTAWTSSSDERLKNILEPITNAVEKIGQLRTIIGTYKNDPDAIKHPFLIAQDVQKVLPEAVDVKNDEIGTLGVRYTEVIPLLAAGIKEMDAKIDTGFVSVSSSTLASWTESGAITTLTDSVKNEAPRNALTYITTKMAAGYKAVSDFTTLRITAIQGYFENIFAKKATLDEVCVKKSNGSYVCLTGDDLEKLKTTVSSSNSGSAAGDSSNSSSSTPTSTSTPASDSSATTTPAETPAPSEESSPTEETAPAETSTPVENPSAEVSPSGDGSAPTGQ